MSDLTFASFLISSCALEDAGVPCVPGYHGDNQDPDFLFKKAQEIGDFCSQIKIPSWLIYLFEVFPSSLKPFTGEEGKACEL